MCVGCVPPGSIWKERSSWALSCQWDSFIQQCHLCFIGERDCSEEGGILEKSEFELTLGVCVFHKFILSFILFQFM